MKTLYLALSALVLCAGSAIAQPSPLNIAGAYLTTPVATNAWVPVNSSDKVPRVLSVTALNSSATDTWLHLFDTNGLPANGTAAHFAPVKVLAGTTGGYDFNVVGCPFTNGLCVVNSTTDRHLTNGSANLVITVLFNNRPK